VSVGIDLLAVMAHPDDAELWAAGALSIAARHSGAHILVATRNTVRAREATEGAALLGAGLDTVPEHDGAAIAEAIARLRPRVLVTHRPDDPHPDHRTACKQVLRALPDAVIETGLPQSLYTCDTYNSLTLTGRVPGSVVLDISAHIDVKLKALSAHGSQPVEHFTAMARRLGEYWGASRGCQWGEAFDPVPVLGCLPAAVRL
jgi:N-acetylglucosamine malate deacetylase 1